MRRLSAGAESSLTLSGTGKQTMGTKMIEQILTRKNLLQAMRQVQKNHGSAGVDHMPVTKLSELLAIDKEELTATVRSGKYLPQPILGVEIPKGNGKYPVTGYSYGNRPFAPASGVTGNQHAVRV